MSVPYTDSEASEARQWSNRYGPPNAWTASFGTAARMIGRLLDERERLMAKQTVAAPGDDYIREWHEEFQRWKAVADAKQDLRDHFAAAALTGLLVHANDGIDEETLDTPSDIAYTAYAMADAMLRERCRAGADCPLPDNAPNHDAAPAARASVDSVAPQPTTRGDSDRTDKAAPRPSEGTGDTPVTNPMPAFLSGSGFVTPISYADSNAKPVAWGVVYPNDEVAVIAFKRNDAEERATASDSIVPLYRAPTLTDEEREAVEWIVENVRLTVGVDRAATLRSLLERIGGGR